MTNNSLSQGWKKRCLMLLKRISDLRVNKTYTGMRLRYTNFLRAHGQVAEAILMNFDLTRQALAISCRPNEDFR